MGHSTFLLDASPCSWGVKLIQFLQVVIDIDCFAKEHGCDYAITRQGTPDFHFLIMEKIPMDNVWNSCGPTPSVPMGSCSHLIGTRFHLS